MGHRWLLTSLAGIVLLISGCSSVILEQPLPAGSDAAARERLQGDWISGDQIISLRFTSSGLGRFAGLGWDGEFHQLEVGELVVSDGAEHGYLSVRVKEKGEWEEGYSFVQYHFTSSEDLILWLPDPQAFKAAVETGALQGVVESGEHSTNVTLTSDPAKILAFIEQEGQRELFDYQDPMVLKRILLGAGGNDG